MPGDGRTPLPPQPSAHVTVLRMLARHLVRICAESRLPEHLFGNFWARHDSKNKSAIAVFVVTDGTPEVRAFLAVRVYAARIPARAIAAALRGRTPNRSPRGLQQCSKSQQGGPLELQMSGKHMHRPPEDRD